MFFGFIALTAAAFSQKIVVSEYNNVPGSTVGEWIELLVVQDNIDISGFKIRDNSSTQNWSGGVIFKDVPLWKHLRKGTVIVIDTRGILALDEDPKDGFINIQAQNTTYFTQYLEPSALDWNTNALNINQQWDVIEILDNNGKHHHALGHTDLPPLTLQDTLSSPKSIHADNFTSVLAVRVWAGDISGYNQGLGTTWSAATGSGTYGTANQGNGNRPDQQNVNQLFWRALRQPDWAAPSAKIESISKSGVNISWSQANDVYPADNTQGYIVLRAPKDNITAMAVPEDGKWYNAGDYINSVTKVVGVNEGNTNTTFTDANPSCDTSYVYRIFSFRYTKSIDYNNIDINPLKGRGRSYNESVFAQVETQKSTPSNFKITIDGGKDKICTDDIILIISNLAKNNNYTYEWQINGAVHSQDKSDTLKVRVSKGIHKYKLKISDPNGCVYYSNEITVTAIDPPNTQIQRIFNGVNYDITKNTTFYICKGDTLKLFGNGGSFSSDYTQDWYKDNKKIATADPYKLNVTESGTYFLVVSNLNLCVDTSYYVTVVANDINFATDKSGLNFVLLLTENDKIEDLVITNNADYDLTIPKDSILISSGFSIDSPKTYPIVVPARKSITLKIKATLTQPGKLSGKMIIISACGQTKIINLMALKQSEGAFMQVQDTLSILKPHCELSRTAKLDFTVLSQYDIDLQDPILRKNNFKLDLTNFKKNMKSGESNSLTVIFDQQTVGQYSDTLVFRFTAKSATPKLDSAKVLILGNNYQLRFEFASTLNFGDMDRCTNDKDSILIVKNDSPEAIDITSANNDNRVLIKNLPLTIQPGMIDSIKFTYSPKNESEDFDLVMKLSPCDTNMTINFKSTHKGYFYSFSKDTLDFGTIFDCKQSNDVSLNLNLNIKNANSESKVKSITIPSNMKVNLKPGDNLSEINNLIVTLLADGSTNYNSTIKFVIEPCNTEMSLEVKGKRVSAKLDYSINSPKKLDFGTVVANNPINKSITITNNSTVDIKLAGISGIALPFKIIQPTLPFVLQSGKNVDLIIEYNQSIEASKDSMDIKLEIAEPCDLSEVITLVAATKDKQKTLNIQVLFPSATVKGEIGKEAKFDLSLKASDLNIMRNTDIKSIKFDIKYNASMLYPKAAKVSSANPGISSISINEVSAGVSEIKFNIADATKLNEDVLGTALFTALLGDNLKTNLKIANPIIESSENYILSTNEGEFELEGGCNLDKRLLGIGKSAVMKLVYKQNSIEINYRVIVDANTSISLYDVNGEEIKQIVGGMHIPGDYSKQFNLNDISSGVYILVYRSQDLLITEKLLINK